MWIKKVNSLAETENLGLILGELVRPGDVICLYGDLGVGKTALSKAIAQGLGVSEHVTSPTYTLINEYLGRLPLYHLDVYRLCDIDEAFDLGLEEYFYGQGVTLIEWPSRIEEILPQQRLDIHIVRDNQEDEERENERRLTFRSFGESYQLLVEELKSKCTF